MCVLIKISSPFVIKGIIAGKLALVPELDWRLAGNKPLPDLRFT